MNPTNIRKAVAADVPAVMAIRAAVHENRESEPSPVTGDDVVEFMQSEDVWVWVERGRILGFSAGDGQCGWIWALFVDPDHQGRGIGQALLRYACRSLIEAGFTHATLTTEPGTRAARFYTRGGWTNAGRTEAGEIIFKRRLPVSRTRRARRVSPVPADA
jgi:ribosomal protein S18 acetylase RimI-like enzyme